MYTSDLADIVPRVRRERVIDITNSPLVPATSLRAKLELLHRAGELDGGLPIIRGEVLVGLIPAPDLEYTLDSLDDEAGSLCLMTTVNTIEDSDDEEDHPDPTDFTPFIDPVSARLQSLDFIELTHRPGTGCSGHQVANGPRPRVFLQARSSVHLRSSEWALRRHGEWFENAPVF